MVQEIVFTLNGREVKLMTDPGRTLLWVLRTDLGLTGPKPGCGEGHCGSCTVLVNQQARQACQMSLEEVKGAQVTTIEGLAEGGKLHPLQQAFMEHDALQCGYCTPGMILSAYSLLKENPSPSREDINSALNDNLCRCGAHQRIVQAIESAAAKLKGGAS
jgi:aerobic-type carbon monoxide dehydrogenase small subunit (CoxS/CutS family)